jgi:hypothetical protein
MARKTFKDNPALQFLTDANEEIKTEEGQPERIQPRAAEAPPEGYKENPRFIELKTRRVQLVLQPSLYERVREAAFDAKLSLNEYIHQLLDNATKEK